MALVDDADFQWLSQWKWYFARRRDGSGYAVRNGRKTEGEQDKSLIKMHRFILNVIDPSIEVDHRNLNKLDNRRLNLRVCSKSENQANMPLKRTSGSGYKGVRWHKRDKKWESRILVKGKMVQLGYFSTKEQAAIAYNEAALTHFGEFARINIVG